MWRKVGYYSVNFGMYFDWWVGEGMDEDAGGVEHKCVETRRLRVEEMVIITGRTVDDDAIVRVENVEEKDEDLVLEP